MAQRQHRIMLAEQGGPSLAGRALASLGGQVDELDMPTVDMAAQEPERLNAMVPFLTDSTALVVAFGPLGDGGAASVDWMRELHNPLRRCFTLIRAIVPSFVARAGGNVIVVLPSRALLADSEKCAESVLGRCLLGLFEGLRAELLSSPVKVTIVLTDETEDEAALAGRLDEAFHRAPLYLLPVSLDAACISALFTPWLQALARTASNPDMPPLGPMGEVYRTELEGAERTGSSGADDWGSELVPKRLDPRGRLSAVTAGKTAIVTGGASGIGLGIAEALLDRGLNVVLCDVRDDHLADAAERLRHHGERLMSLRLDVMDRRAWQEAAKAVVARFDAIDLLCLNAGIGVLGTILDSRPADWQWLMGVNLAGVTNGVETVLPLMRARGAGGYVMATSSAGGLMVATDGGIYSAAKYGVIALMDCLRAELLPEAIGVTTLCPAGVNTNIHDHETMRPDAFSDSGVRGDEAERIARQAMARKMLSAGADPNMVGKQVLDAIDRNAPILFTDGSIAPIIELRRQALLRATQAAAHASMEG